MLSTNEPQSVVVIGASRGIGAAIASTFASHGHKVIGTHRGSGVPAGIDGFEADITDEAQLAALFKHAVATNGKIDALVISSGITRDELIVRMSEEDIRAVIDTNLIGPMLAVKTAFTKMARGGSITIISSASARVGHKGQANYTAAKAGLDGLVKTVAIEAAGRFRINLVSPGPTKTDMYNAVDEAAQKFMDSSTLRGAAATPDEIANDVYWVSQSPNMTGYNVPSAGGA